MLLPVLNATCLYMKSWYNVMKWIPNAEMNKLSHKLTKVMKNTFMHIMTTYSYTKGFETDWHVHRFAEYGMLPSHSQSITVSNPFCVNGGGGGGGGMNDGRE